MATAQLALNVEQDVTLPSTAGLRRRVQMPPRLSSLNVELRSTAAIDLEIIDAADESDSSGGTPTTLAANTDHLIAMPRGEFSLSGASGQTITVQAVEPAGGTATDVGDSGDSGGDGGDGSGTPTRIVATQVINAAVLALATEENGTSGTLTSYSVAGDDTITFNVPALGAFTPGHRGADGFVWDPVVLFPEYDRTLHDIEWLIEDVGGTVGANGGVAAGIRTGPKATAVAVGGFTDANTRALGWNATTSESSPAHLGLDQTIVRCVSSKNDEAHAIILTRETDSTPDFDLAGSIRSGTTFDWTNLEPFLDVMTYGAVSAGTITCKVTAHLVLKYSQE